MPSFSKVSRSPLSIKVRKIMAIFLLLVGDCMEGPRTGKEAKELERRQAHVTCGDHSWRLIEKSFVVVNLSTW